LRARNGTLLAVTLAAAVIGSACGGSDESKVEETVRTYLNGIADGDGQTACDQLTGAAKRELTTALTELVPELNAASCEDAIDGLAENLGEDERRVLRDADLNVAVSGDSATATPTEGTSDVKLEKADGEWLISGGFEFPGAQTGNLDDGPAEPTPDAAPDEPVAVAPIRGRLQSAGYAVSEVDPGSGSPPALAALEVKLGGGQVKVYFYGSAFDAKAALRQFQPIEKENPDQFEVSASSSRLYVGTIEEPAVLPLNEFNDVVAEAEGF